MTVFSPWQAAVGLAVFALLPRLGAAPVRAQEEGPSRARTHLVTGELARLDLGRRVLVVKVKPTEGAPYELEVQTDEGTRISSRGRALALSEMHPGERVLVSCSDEGPRHRALLVKMGTPRKSPLPQPKTAASPAGS
jgi:hypothetical protein